ncbi:hypothetical protein V6Z12_D04G181100 [Gossypium hirsutum]
MPSYLEVTRCHIQGFPFLLQGSKTRNPAADFAAPPLSPVADDKRPRGGARGRQWWQRRASGGVDWRRGRRGGHVRHAAAS